MRIEYALKRHCLCARTRTANSEVSAVLEKECNEVVVIRTFFELLQSLVGRNICSLTAKININSAKQCGKIVCVFTQKFTVWSDVYKIFLCFFKWVTLRH